jgi:hypothetical protein
VGAPARNPGMPAPARPQGGGPCCFRMQAVGARAGTRAHCAEIRLLTWREADSGDGREEAADVPQVGEGQVEGMLVLG